MRYFVLFEYDGVSFIKKIAGYDQFDGVRVTTVAADDSSGSGKSISMCCYAGKLQ